MQMSELTHHYDNPNISYSYFRIPSGEKRKVARKQWLQKLRNVRSNLNLSNNTRVCSLHFVSADFMSNGDLNPEAVPSLFQSKALRPETDTRVNPLERIRATKFELPQVPCAEPVLEIAEEEIADSPHTSSKSPEICQLVTVGTQTVDYKCRNCSKDLPIMVDFGCQCVLADINVDDMRNDDKKTRFFTGFVNYGTFLLMLNVLVKHAADRLNYWDGEESLIDKDYQEGEKKKPGRKRQLDMKTEFLMTMMWYRLGLLQEHLSSIFKVSVSSVSRILTTWTQFIYEHLTGFIYLPSREQVLINMPSHFVNHSNVYIIFDCTEFFVEKPSGLEAQAVTWSEYKHSNTIKCLIGVSPTGMTTFVSRAWGGRASDRHIVEKENALANVPEGMAIMADKGFEVEDLAPPGVQVIIPPKVSTKSQMSDFEFFKTVDIAEPRIVVEMKMEQAKNYQILQSTIPISRIATAEQVIYNCFALTNLLPPLFVPATAASSSLKIPVYTL